MASGREGDWECGGCQNRNYAFRSFCNRCKQPRLLVDIKTPADSKWLPRIGDWICIGCSNNNYASREKCKKCGQSKEETAMPAIAMLGASLPAFTHNLSRSDGVLGMKMNLGMVESYFHQSQGLDYKNGVQSVAGWPYSGPPKGWRMGDWICNCGFHNYSSRAQCKKCNGPLTPGILPSVANYAVTDLSLGPGSKRLASEEFVYELDSKRLNAGDTESHFLGGSRSNQVHGMHSKYGIGSSMMPAILGKGAKQWRDGDWMCSHCNNHNFATRSFCNRCKTGKDGAPHPVSVV